MHFLPGLLRHLKGDRLERSCRRREGRPHAPAEHELHRRETVRPRAVVKLKQGAGVAFPSRNALEKEFLSVFDGCLRQPVGPWVVRTGGFQLDDPLAAERQELLATKLGSTVRPDDGREAKKL